MIKINFKRGLAANLLDVLTQNGTFYLTTDNHYLYIGNNDLKMRIIDIDSATYEIEESIVINSREDEVE